MTDTPTPDTTMTDTPMTDIPNVEHELARDMIVRALPVLPLIVAVAWVTRGGDGALSAGFGIALVLANLVLSAVLLAWAARVSPSVLMATTLGGFVVRMALVGFALLRGQGPQLGRPAGARGHRPRHAPRAAVLGDPLCLRLACLPRPEAAPHKEPDRVILGPRVPARLATSSNGPTLFGSGPFAVNKVVLLMWSRRRADLRAVFFLAARKADGLVPTGVQNVAEAVGRLRRGRHRSCRRSVPTA